MTLTSLLLSSGVMYSFMSRVFSPGDHTCGIKPRVMSSPLRVQHPLPRVRAGGRRQTCGGAQQGQLVLTWMIPVRWLGLHLRTIPHTPGHGCRSSSALSFMNGSGKARAGQWTTPRPASNTFTFTGASTDTAKFPVLPGRQDLHRHHRFRYPGQGNAQLGRGRDPLPRRPLGGPGTSMTFRRAAAARGLGRRCTSCGYRCVPLPWN
jgi:hypothetical protein